MSVLAQQEAGGRASRAGGPCGVGARSCGEAGGDVGAERCGSLLDGASHSQVECPDAAVVAVLLTPSNVGGCSEDAEGE